MAYVAFRMTAQAREGSSRYADIRTYTLAEVLCVMSKEIDMLKSQMHYVLLLIAGVALLAAYPLYRFTAREAVAASPTKSDGALEQPPGLKLERSADGSLTGTLTARPERLTIAGHQANLLTYNGSYPGPTIRVREGDRVTLRFANQLSEPTSLHLHGLHIPPEVDDPFRVVQPGASAEYSFTLPARSAGTYWYHTHLHGSAAPQLFAGLAGAIVVEGQLDAEAGLKDAEEHVLVLKDLALTNGQPAQGGELEEMNGREGNLVLVNGMWQPVLRPNTGMLRLRLVNAGNARYYRLKLDQHPLYLIATVGGPIERPAALDELLLAPGERAEVLVRLDRAGRFQLLNLPYDRGKHGAEPDTEQAPLLTIDAGSGLEAAALPTRLAEVEQLDLSQATVTRKVILEEQMSPVRFFINGRPFVMNRVDFHARVGDLEIWEIENRTEMDHPFHLHTYSFQVLSRNGVAEPFRAWRDVVNVKANEVVRIAVPLRDFTGKTVFHCHIVEHEELGMMAILQVNDRSAPRQPSLEPVPAPSAPGSGQDHSGH